VKILFNYDGLDIRRFGGVSLYAYELICHFTPEFQAVLGLAVSSNVSFQQYPGVREPPSFFTRNGLLPERLRHALCWRYGRFQNQRFLREKMGRGERCDLLHVVWDLEEQFFHFLEDLPFVFTAHDLIPEIFGSGGGAFIQRRKWLAEHAARIIAVSEHTKRDCMRFWGVPDEKVDVVYHAPSAVQKMKGSWGGGEAYVLYVGNRGGYKNFAWFAEALAPLLLQRPHLKLVCTGSPFNRDEVTLLVKLGIRDKTSVRFIHPDHFSALYGGASVFVYPSLYEGFGMPILDAFQSGCPVLLSRCSCFPEIGSDAALYFDPGDAESLRGQVARCLDDTSHRDDLIQKGRARAKQFSWTKAARETCEVYRKVLA
jgi:glycosyltransferase involved in cell wall biosynthesis